MRTAIDRLTELDRMLLGVSRRWPQDIGALAILDGAGLLDPACGLRIDAVRAVMPRGSTRCPVSGRSSACRAGAAEDRRVDAARFDVPDHVLVRPLEPGTAHAGLLAVALASPRGRDLPVA